MKEGRILDSGCLDSIPDFSTQYLVTLGCLSSLCLHFFICDLGCRNIEMR